MYFKANFQTLMIVYLFISLTKWGCKFKYARKSHAKKVGSDSTPVVSNSSYTTKVNSLEILAAWQCPSISWWEMPIVCKAKGGKCLGRISKLVGEGCLDWWWLWSFQKHAKVLFSYGLIKVDQEITFSRF